MQDFGHQQYHAYKFHLQPAFTRFKSESKAHSAVAMVGGERSEVLSRPWQNSRSIPLPLKRLHENLLNLKRWWMKMFGRNLSNYCRSLEAERHNIHTIKSTSTTTHLFKSLASLVLLFTPWPPCQNHPQQHALTAKSSCAPNMSICCIYPTWFLDTRFQKTSPAKVF